MSAALLGCRSGREPAALTDGRMRVQRLQLVLAAERAEHVVGSLERVLDLGETLDQSRSPFEQLRELLDAQLPR